jgi:6-phosphogluconolactonase (cycloisomerase 2 family)
MKRTSFRFAWCAVLLGSAAILLACKSSGTNEKAGRAAAMPAQPPATSSIVVYASAGKTLRTFGFDPATGEISPRQTLPELKSDIHYVAFHPNHKYLYVSVGENPPPKDRPQVAALYAFAIDAKTGALTQLGEPYTSPLSRAIHITVDQTGSYLLTAHNATETVGAVRIKPDGSLGEPVRQAEERQHLGFFPHQVRIDPSNTWAFVPVRGDDEKVTLENGAKKVEPERFGHLAVLEFHDGLLTKRHVVDYPSLLGPRHLDFNPTMPLFYVSMERGNRLLTYRYVNGDLTQLFDTTTLADPSLKNMVQRAGPIHVHPSGKWVYLANRSTAPCSPGPPCSTPFGDRGENDIAVFAINAASGEPKLLQNVDTHGFEPRTFTLDPTLHFLIVGNQKEVPRKQGDTIVKVEPNLSEFRIGDDGKLTYVRSYDQAGGEVWWVGALALPASGR